MIEMTQKITARPLSEEFPGLEAICRKTFDVSYDEATPNLREHCRVIAMRDAAQNMLEMLKAAQEELRLIRMKDTTACYNPGLRSQISIAIDLAEGRTVPAAKGAK
jgi:hypothetical protein